MKMSKVSMDDWLSTLRSGKYEQTTAKLVDDGKFCCLGVLCDMAGGVWSDVDETVYVNDTSFGYGDVEGILEVCLDDDGQERVEKLLLESRDFSDLNDSWNASFEEIADTFENAERLGETSMPAILMSEVRDD